MAKASLSNSKIGVVQPFAGAFVPTGFLLCDGSAVSRTTYAQLFAVIGTAHGQGDGSTTFHLPDYRGKFLRGVDSGSGNDLDSATRSASNVGGNTGDNVGSVQDSATASPSTPFTGATTSTGSHNHNVTNVQYGASDSDNPSNENSFATGLPGANTVRTNTLGSSSGTHNHNIQVNAGGDSETRPKNVNVTYIISY